MVSINYANAYKEVLVVINNLVKEDYNKIPKEYIEFLSANCNNSYEFEYDKTKTFKEQNLLDDSKYILFGLFEKYGATEKQKDKIKNYRNNFYNKLEEERLEKYNPNALFKNRHQIEDTQNNTPNNTNLVIYKESIFKKFINKMKSIFHIK